MSTPVLATSRAITSPRGCCVPRLSTGGIGRFWAATGVAGQRPSCTPRPAPVSTTTSIPSPTFRTSSVACRPTPREDSTSSCQTSGSRHTPPRGARRPRESSPPGVTAPDVGTDALPRRSSPGRSFGSLPRERGLPRPARIECAVDACDPESRGPDEHSQTGQDHRRAFRGVPDRPGGQAQPEDLRQVRRDHRPLPVVPGALLARPLGERIRRGHQDPGDLLRHVRGRGHHLRVLGVPRLFHAPQGHRRQRDDEGCRDGHQEARPVAGQEGLHRGR